MIIEENSSKQGNPHKNKARAFGSEYNLPHFSQEAGFQEVSVIRSQAALNLRIV